MEQPVATRHSKATTMYFIPFPLFSEPDLSTIYRIQQNCSSPK